MQLLINIIFSSFIQFVLCAIIPFIWWVITAKKEKSFFQWIGYRKPQINDKKRFWSSLLLIEVVFLGISLVIIPILNNNETLATSQFHGLGITALLPALIYAFFQTSFNEELFFRGFLGKRLIDKFGFAFGNSLQGILFGLMHGIMLFSTAGLLKALMITIFTGAIGLCMGYMSEKLSKGSIVPSWLIHGTFNTLSSVLIMFNLI